LCGQGVAKLYSVTAPWTTKGVSLFDPYNVSPVRVRAFCEIW